jgi:hypothetical protein
MVWVRVERTTFSRGGMGRRAASSISSGGGFTK